MSEGSQSLLREAILQICAGGFAGFVEICLMHPLDVIKTRMQLQSSKPSFVSGNGIEFYYVGPIDCIRKMYRNEGSISFYKGVLPPILAESPKRALKFFSFQQYKKLFSPESGVPGPLTFSLAGACAGITEAIFINPFEVVKVRLQSDRSTSANRPTATSVTKEIVKTDGFLGLLRGVSGTVARNGTFNAAYFGFYFSGKNSLPEFENETAGFVAKFALGFASGTLASCLNIPFDVAKSRMQGPRLPSGEIKYLRLLPTLRLIYVEEGWKALYKGLAPKVMRLGPGGAVMLVAYEYSHDAMRRWISE